MYHSIALVVALLAGTGCASSTPVTVVDGDRTLALNRDVVLNCRVGQMEARRNLTFAENYLSPPPDFPSEGIVYDLPLRIECVVKGRYRGSALRIEDAQGPDDRVKRRSSKLRELARDETVLLAFNRNFLGVRTDYLLVRHPTPGE